MRATLLIPALLLLITFNSLTAQSSYTVYYKPQGSYVPPAYTRYTPPYTPPSYNSYNNYKPYTPTYYNYGGNNNSGYKSGYSRPSYQSSTPSYSKPVDPAANYLYGKDLNTENYVKAFIEKYDARDYKAAIGIVDKIALVNMKNPKKFAAMALFSFLHAGKYNEGVAYFNSYVKTNYSDEVDKAVLGDLFYETKNYKKAIEYYTKTTTRTLKTTEKLAYAYYAENDRYNAAIQFDKYFKDGGREPWLRVLLGYCYYERYTNSKLDLDYRKAMEAFNECIKTQSTFLLTKVKYPEPYIYRADLYLYKRKPDDALADLKMAEELGYDNEVINIYYSNVFFQKGEYKKAIDVLDKLLAVKPNDADALNRRATMKALNKDYQGAMIDVNKAISINQKEADFYDTRAYVYYHTGEYNKALIDYNKAIAEGMNKNGALYYFRGLTYQKLGRINEACGDWTKADEFGIDNLIVESDAAAKAKAAFCK